MPRVADLVGKRSGHLVVVSRGPNDAKSGSQWNCQCDCGKHVLIRGQYLVHSARGYQQNYCSHQCDLRLNDIRLNVTNKRFSRLVAIQSIAESNKNGEALWQFRCDCGNSVIRSVVGVKRGHTHSCGCLHRDVFFKHGQSDTAAYRTSRTRKWRENHPERAHAMSSNSQANRALRAPKWLTEEQKMQMGDYYRLANQLTDTTGIEHHVDHIYPLQGKTCSGLHVPWNLQVLVGNDNRQKSNKVPEDIVQSGR